MRRIDIYHPALRRHRVRHIATAREYLIGAAVLIIIALVAALISS
jgi:hypothetical protein